jgi:hypothetical protein
VEHFSFIFCNSSNFVRERHTGNHAPSKVLLVQITSFLSSVEELMLLLFD